MIRGLYILILGGLLMTLFGSCKKSSTDSNGPNLPVLPGWELIWNDEFDEPEIDPQKWEHEVNNSGGGNNELQYYTDRPVNSRIEDGILVLEAHREYYGSGNDQRDYTSARLRTLNRGDWLHGRFDIRAKLPQGQGMWPAIWMLPTDWVYGGWPSSGEIDIMEAVNLGAGNNRIYGTIHYENENGQHSHHGGNASSPTNFWDEFHTFSLEWESYELRWYLDDVLYYTTNNWSCPDAPYPAPFDRHFHLLLNVAVGGTWPGDPNHLTPFPQRMEVEYVRVWSKITDE